MRLLTCVLATAAAWDSLEWLGGGFRGPSCADKRWVALFNETQTRMLAGVIGPRFVVVTPHSKAGLGNRLRAVRAGLALAALTKRCLVLDYSSLDPENRGRRAGESRWLDGTELDVLAPNLVRWDAARTLYEATAKVRGRDAWTLPMNGKGLDGGKLLAYNGLAMVVAAWNHDPTAKLLRAPAVRSAAAAAGLADDDGASRGCALRALFGADAGASGRFAAAGVAGARRDPRRRAALRRTATTLLVAADDDGLVDAARARADFGAAVALPGRVRHHSGISRAEKQARARASQSHVLGHGDVLGPLLDMLLIASADAFVGTAGSSFSEQARDWGGFGGDRKAVLFTTPYVKSARATRTAPLPATPAEAELACRKVT
ncbi:hypothetical protein SO694_00026153 [Aureococcus anophagefferens]|uniref:Uncharacterized protein n=1 Tax=Aureococcus anophagefferens TaxID=44056 RepID=A0ABR1FUH6_AURAN